ncbi:hypothetical protein LCGC14_0372920 [marine sediment metagenome]|uniref:Uncharacterized protein n=1 Tax=marine sediment metagenome TaxID=412755 RepID=A0A0F9VS42_9ZZZZ
MIESTKCYHQSTTMYDEFEDEKGEIIYADFEVCRECNMVIFNGEEMGLIN